MSDRFLPSVLRVLTLVGIVCLATLKIYAQNPDQYYLVPDKTYSNRTTDNLNNGNVNPANKTWTFADYTSSWDSRYYKGDVTKPAYTEGYLAQYSSLDFKMNYRLLFPVGYNAPENANYKWPLIIMMHGAGESGVPAGSTQTQRDSSRQFLNNDKNVVNGGEVHLNSVYLANGKKAEDPTLLARAFPGLVLFPQQANGNWYPSNIALATGILERVIATYNVDPDRIYIHGLSLGGAAVWDMVNTKPQLYAASLPMSATITSGSDIFNSRVDKAVPIPTWIFQGGLDGAPTPNNTNQLVDKLKAAGANVRYTIYPNIGHGTWGTAYTEPDFFSWMLSKSKSDITVLYQNPTICPTLTSGGGAKLAVGTDFLAYQWEKDGVIISGATSNTYTASASGTYRARYSRISANPSEAQWNKWSKPVVITEASPVSTAITATNSTHFPDININFPSFTTDNGSTKWYSVSLQGPVQTDTYYDWYNGTTLLSSETANTLVRSINNYNIGNPNWSGVAGTYTLKTRSLSGCPSLVSNSISITTGTPATLAAPSLFQAQVNSSGSVQLFWKDNANNEKGYEIQRATVANGPYTFFKLVGEDVVSYNDTGLIPNTTYYYRIRAVNDAVTSPYNSSDLVVGTSIDTTPPSAPQNLVKITNSINTVKLGWTAATDISGIKKYIITYGGNTVDTGSADTNYTITGLTPNTNYTFTVKAVDNADLSSQPSNQLLTSTVFSGLTYEHSPDNVGDGNVHSPENSLYGIDWGYYEYAGHVNNFDITPRVQDNYFNFKFNGYIKVPSNGNYNFRLSGNDAANLYLGSSGTYVNTTTAFTYPGVNSYWTALNTGLTNTVRFINGSLGSTAYAATNGGVFRTTLNGSTGVWATWSNVGSSLPELANADVKFIAIATISGTSYVFAATSIGVFQATTASGTNWTAKGLSGLDVRHITVNGSNIYASTNNGVYLSTDNGTTWNTMNSGLSNTDVRYIVTTGSGAPTAINAYAATSTGVFLSVNGGNWALKLSGQDVRCVNVIGSSIFAGTAAGLYVSADVGATWAAKNTGLSNTSVLSMAPLSSGANNLFVGTDSGVYMYSYTIQNTWTARPIGLANTTINSISIGAGNLFAGTPSGAMLSINSGANWATTNRIIELNGTRDACATSGTATVNGLNVANFYPISLIYFDLVDDECLTVEWKLTSSSVWAPIPDSWFQSGTTPTPTAPLVPTNLAANSTGMTSIQLTWSHASTTDDFEIYRSTDNVTYAIVATLTEDNLSTHTYADTTLTPATLYYYKIRSITAAGGGSGYTVPVSATTDPDSEAPTVPQNVVVVTSTYTNAGLKWTASIDNVQVAGYKIFANGDLLGTSTTATYFTSALSPSTTYNFTVVAYDLNGNESAASAAASVTTVSAFPFYSKSSGDLSLLSSWTDSSSGTGGTAPTSFSLNGQQFNVRVSTTLSNSLTIGGANSRLVVPTGVTFTLTAAVNGKISIQGNGKITINNNFTGYDFDLLSESSIVTFNTYIAVPVEKYGNLILNGSGIKTIPGGILEVQGDLTVGNGVELKGASANGTTLKIGGSFTTGITTPTVSPDNLLSLQFDENKYHDFTLSSDQSLYSIIAKANSTVNTTNADKTIKVGSLNGGGLNLESGSVLTLGNNNLSLVGASSINPANTTGQLSLTYSNIQLTTSSSSPSNLYFIAGENKVHSFTLQSTGGALTSIRQPLEIYDGIKINAGTLSSGGNITLKSNADSTASIRQIVNGSITGDVTVERFMTPSGELFRYLSSPVAGVTVASWQNYLPVTGTFTGANTGDELGTDPSMYTYTEPNYVAFPATDNSQQLQQGRGYAAYIYNSALPTLKSTGVPYQGAVSFTSLLTPDTGPTDPDDGWNLIGNPYASDIVWSNDAAAWTYSGIADVIAVSDNRSGELVYKYWNRQGGSGPGDGLENGKIPAGQAFWVQSTTASPSLIVNEGAKTTDPASDNNEFYRTSSARTAVNNAFSFELDNGVNKDVAYVKFSDGGLDSYVKQTDGAKKQNSIFNLSTSSTDGVALAMNDLSIEFCEKTIPVNIKDATAGSYHLRFNNTDQFVMSNLVLQDKYLGTEQAINTGNNDIVITIDNEAASAHNRFYLKLSRPDVLTNMTVASDKKNFCSSEQMVTVTINDSQPGVEYTAFLGATVSTGVKQTGTGKAIQLLVPVSLLTSSENAISLQASFPGCTVKVLDKPVVVNKINIPVLTGADDYYGCVGSAMDIKVSSSSSAVSYQWKDITNSKDLNETKGTLSIAQLADVNYYSVTAVDVNGCESVSKSILVRSDTLITPVVIIKNEVLSVSTKADDIQWLLDGQIIRDAVSKEYTPSISGDYVVKVTNNYCVKESEPVAYIVTGLGEPTNGELSLQLYPNPSEHGDVTITGQSNSTSSLQIQLLDLAGRQLIHRETSYEEYAKGVKVKGELSAGAYIVRVIQDGTIRFKKLLIL